MRLVLVLAVAFAIVLGCVSFGLDSRRFRCEADTDCGAGLVCGPDGYCAPTGAADASVDVMANDGATGEICNNNVDDDGDGAVDCADSECPGTLTCGAGCMCSGGVPTEIACMDGIDNDRKDGADCNDPDCAQCMGTLVCCPDGLCRTSC